MLQKDAEHVDSSSMANAARCERLLRILQTHCGLVVSKTHRPPDTVKTPDVIRRVPRRCVRPERFIQTSESPTRFLKCTVPSQFNKCYIKRLEIVLGKWYCQMSRTKLVEFKNNSRVLLLEFSDVAAAIRTQRRQWSIYDVTLELDFHAGSV